MPIHFPRPLPDEIIGSLCIRACRHLGLSYKSFNRRVLGIPVGNVSYLLSGALPRLSELTNIDPADLLVQHTVFPYVTAYLPEKQASKLRQQLVVPTKEGKSTFASLIHNATKCKVGRRICPACIAEELRTNGETYWHRSHLLPGVLICPVHGRKLWVEGIYQHDKLTLPHEVHSEPVTSYLSYEKMQRLSLLSTARLYGPNQVDVHTSYRSLATSLGYQITNRELAARQLSRELAQYYGNSFLTLFDCALSPNETSYWPAMMIRTTAKGPFAPLKHILLKDFLEHAPQVQTITQKRQCGRAPADYSVLDKEIVKRYMKAVHCLELEGQVMNAWDLLKKIGALQTYRHNRPLMPLTKSAVEQFRQSAQCIWRINRKPELKS